MKAITEIRMWMAEKLLGWAFDMSPYNKCGQKMRIHISNYYMEKIIEQEQS